MNEVLELESLAAAYEQELRESPDDVLLQYTISSLRQRIARLQTEASTPSGNAPATQLGTFPPLNIVTRLTEAPSKSTAEEITPQWLWLSHM